MPNYKTELWKWKGQASGGRTTIDKSQQFWKVNGKGFLPIRNHQNHRLIYQHLKICNLLPKSNVLMKRESLVAIKTKSHGTSKAACGRSTEYLRRPFTIHLIVPPLLKKQSTTQIFF